MHEFRRWPGCKWQVLSCAVVVLAAGVLSCGSEQEPPPVPVVDEVAPSRIEITGGIREGAKFSGQTTLKAVAEDDSGQVVKVSFFVSSRLACADAEAKASGATFSCAWDTAGTPAGSYQLTATAQDSTGNTALSAPIAFMVGVNVPPTISAAGASASSINEGQSTNLSVTAADQAGDTLSYAWEQLSPAAPQGTFTGANTATPTWKAPLLSVATTFKLQVTVSDGEGAAAQRTVDVQVANVASANRAPTVDPTITAPTAVLAGDDAALSIGATDPDGDVLTYTWKTSPTAGVGTFTSTSAASTGWRSPDIAADTSYSLQVTVSDGVASVTRTVSVKATVPRYAADLQSIWTAKCTSCHSGASPTGGLDLSQGVSYSKLVNVAGTNSTCSTLKRVLSTKPDSSLLVKKISGATCGTQMPKNDPTYFNTNPGLVTRIRSWILAGAANN